MVILNLRSVGTKMVWPIDLKTAVNTTYFGCCRLVSRHWRYRTISPNKRELFFDLVHSFCLILPGLILRGGRSWGECVSKSWCLTVLSLVMHVMLGHAVKEPFRWQIQLNCWMIRIYCVGISWVITYSTAAYPKCSVGHEAQVMLGCLVSTRYCSSSLLDSL